MYSLTLSHPQGKFQEKQKEIAFLEAQVYRFSEMLGVSGWRVKGLGGAAIKFLCTHVLKNSPLSYLGDQVVFMGRP